MSIFFDKVIIMKNKQNILIISTISMLSIFKIDKRMFIILNVKNYTR